MRLPYPPHPVEDEEVGGEQEEQQDALEDAGQRRGQAERHLHGFAAEEEQRHQQAGEHDAEGVEPADEGDDDRRKAVARRDVRRQLAERPGGLRHAGDPCRGAPGKQPIQTAADSRKPA